MAKFVTLSVNELRSLLFRYFEVVLSNDHDFYDAATLVLWLEAHGLDGVNTLLDAHSCETRNVELKSRTVGTSYAREEFDFENTNSICAGLMVADFSIASAMSSNDISYAQIHNCDALQILVALLARCAAQGLNAYAVWNETVGEECYFASIEARHATPEIYTTDNIAKYELAPGRGFLVCASDGNTLREFANQEHEIALFVDKLQKLVSASQLTSAYEQSIQRGITFATSAHEKLSVVADKILVEASEMSRRGAGD